MRRVVLLAGLLALGVAPAARAKPADDDVTLRGAATIEEVLGQLQQAVEDGGAPAVLVAFDHTTFAPPPGRNEYRYDHDYASDLDAWLDGLERWGQRTEVPLRAVTTTGESAVRVGRAGWRVTLREQVEADVWSGSGRLEPALAWIRRWMPRGKGRAKRALLVLVANEMTPERWAEGPEPWRRRLLPVGDYWDAEAIGGALSKSHCALWVVGPEVRFGDEVPFATLPHLPWASKPQRPPPDLYGSWGSDNDAAYDQMLREDLERDLADEYPDPVERKKVIDEILAPPEPSAPDRPPAPEGERTTPAGPDPDAGREGVPSASGGRYTSGTPVLFPTWGGRVLFGNDVPSGFGYWPFARAAALSGGRYVFYPYPASRWLDACPRDPHALNRTAPPLVAPDAWAGELRGDAALDALCRATALVISETPWGFDGGSGASGGWSAFSAAKPPKRDATWRPRRIPSDRFLVGSAGQLRAVGRSLERAIPRYDQALTLLDGAIARVDEGRDRSSSDRTVADLRLGRFWFALSAFHMEALALCLKELERYVPAGWDETQGELFVSHLPMIKVSDVVPAYDGRTVPPETESHYPRSLHRAWSFPGREDGPARWEPGEIVPGQQGNILQIATGHPDYRAERDPAAVLAHVDPRLESRARDLIRAARAVMTHHARTPWGWSVYYTEVQGFIFDPVDGGLDVRPRGGDEEPATPWRPTRPGGSTPGGPTSGGR